MINLMQCSNLRIVKRSWPPPRLSPGLRTIIDGKIGAIPKICHGYATVGSPFFSRTVFI
jgi:hypothetical protein